jgi:hypothetical protein
MVKFYSISCMTLDSEVPIQTYKAEKQLLIKMNRTIISFIVLVVLLFLGIGILMNPSILVTLSGSSAGDQTADNNPAIKAFITLGSAFLLVGLVGLAVLGFLIAGKDESQERQART